MPHVINDGVRIHYEVVEGDGPPLMLHCGFTHSLKRWHQVGYVDALRDDYRLILIDPRGHGESGKPHDVDAYALPNYVRDVAAVLDELDVANTHFFGYSMGGAIGFAAVAFAPERLRSLILGGSSPYFNDPDFSPVAVAREQAAILRQGMDVFVERLEQHSGPMSADERAQVLDNDGEALAANRLASETFPDISEQINGSTLPALIYCGAEDHVHDLARRAADAMPNARFLSFDGVPHLPMFLQSELILPHVRAFLKEVVR